MLRRTSQAGIDLLKHFEGCKLTAYPDASPRRVWTIGFGHTGAGVIQGLTISQARADQLLAADLVSFETAVGSAVRVPLTQGQFDALVCFSFNCRDWRGSKLIRLVNQSEFALAAAEFARWNHAGDGVLDGLTVRRAAERKLFESPAGPDVDAPIDYLDV